MQVLFDVHLLVLGIFLEKPFDMSTKDLLIHMYEKRVQTKLTVKMMVEMMIAICHDDVDECDDDDDDDNNDDDDGDDTNDGDDLMM